MNSNGDTTGGEQVAHETRHGREFSLVHLQRQLTVSVLAMVALLLAGSITYFFSDTVRILGFSILFSYLFINVVDWLEKLFNNRGLSILVVYLALGVLIAIGVTFVVPSVIYQVSQLLAAVFDHFPQWMNNLVRALHPLEQRLHAAQIQIRAIDILTGIANTVPKPDPSQIIIRATELAMGTLGWLFYLLSIIVVSFYFLLDGRNIKRKVISAFPHQQHYLLNTLATDIDRMLQSFFRGQVVLAVGTGAVMLLVYLALGVHYALLLAVFLAVWEIIPVIGPTIGFIPTLFAVTVDGVDALPMNRFAQVVIIFLVFNLIQWLKDNFVAPRYMGNVLGLHPVVIFIAIMLGARIDGLSGVIWSLPLACVVNVVVSHFSVRNKAETATEIAEEKHIDFVPVPVDQDGKPVAEGATAATPTVVEAGESSATSAG